MKRQLKTVVALTAAVAMTMASVMTASAATWKEDSKGWRVENEDGTYLVNQWYQSPASGLWYYMGADGYMLTNATTPDGYQVNADGVWEQGGNTNAQQTDSVKDVASVQTAVKMYKDYLQHNTAYHLRNYVFVDLDGDGIPECVDTNGETFRILVCVGNEAKQGTYYSGSSKITLSYLKGGNAVHITRDHDGMLDSMFYQLDKNDTSIFHQIGSSTGPLLDGSYSILGEANVSKARFDEYNNSFGTFTEIPLDSAHTYKSIDEAYEAFIAQ